MYTDTHTHTHTHTHTNTLTGICNYVLIHYNCHVKLYVLKVRSQLICEITNKT